MRRGTRLKKAGSEHPELLHDRMARLDRVEVSQFEAHQEKQAQENQQLGQPQVQNPQQPSFLRGMANFYSGVAKGVVRKVRDAQQTSDPD